MASWRAPTPCADTCLTAEQTIRIVYARGKCIEDATLPLGAMAIVGLSWERAQRTCPHTLTQTCPHTNTDSISASADYFVDSLCGPVFLAEALAKIPDNAIVLELGPSAPLCAILGRELANKNALFLPLMNATATGKDGESGFNHDLVNPFVID